MYVYNIYIYTMILMVFFLLFTIRDYDVIMSMSSIACFLKKAKLIILLMGTATRNSNCTFKTPSNSLKAIPGKENLGKFYSRLLMYIYIYR